MNNPKITLEQFNEFKNRCRAIIKETEEDYEKNKDNPNYNSSELEATLVKRYLEVQSELLKFDLSPIPFSEWKNFMIMADKDHPVDLSSTHANIDFSIFEYNGGINFKGCKIQNIRTLKQILKSSDFDQDVIDKNKEMFVSDLFSEELQQKLFDKQLTIQDLFTLSPEQINELRTKNFLSSFEWQSRELINLVGLNSLIQLYAISKDDFQAVYDMFSKVGTGRYFSDPFQTNDAKEIFKKINPTELKKAFFELERQRILSDKYSKIEPSKYPESFVKENDDIFMINVEMPDELRQRFYERKLSFDDVKDNIKLFRNLPLDSFTYHSQFDDEASRGFAYVVNSLGNKITAEALAIYPEIFNYIIRGDLSRDFADFVSQANKLELNMTGDDKKRLINFLTPFLTAKNKLTTKNQLMLYNPSLFPLDEKQKRVINSLGLDNIKKLEEELGFFSHQANTWSRGLETLSTFESYFQMNKDKLDRLFNFQNGTLSYEDFLNEMANCLDVMRKTNLFTDFPNYDWIQGDFRNQHPEIFMDMEAPAELRKAFYGNKIEPEYIQQHPEYIKFLLDKNMANTIRADAKLMIPSMVDANGNIMTNAVNFIEEYSKRYGNEAMLDLCSKYGKMLSSIGVLSIHNEIDNKEAIETNLRTAISKRILEGYFSFEELKNVPEFVREHPDMFVDFSSLSSIPKEEQERLNTAFYKRELKFGDLRKYPELAKYLKDKNIAIGFGYYSKLDVVRNQRESRTQSYRYVSQEHSDMELLTAFGKDKFLNLCTKYGRYLDGVNFELHQYLTFENGQYLTKDEKKPLSYEDIEKEIEKYIVNEVFKGNIGSHHNDAPEFLLQSHPEFFLAQNAPQELQEAFYNVNGGHFFTFGVLKEHKDWIPFLKGKAVGVALSRQSRNRNYAENFKNYFDLFGEKALQIGINRSETVERMIYSNQVDLMKQWYDKTGGKFVPDYIVMQNFPIEQADKFLLAGSNWSNLMRNKSFASAGESRDAMLKLAYSFGAFDQDQRGFKKLQELLTSLPRNISPSYAHIMESISSLEEHGKKLSETNFGAPQGYDEYLQLKEMLVKEGLKLNEGQELFSQIYKKNENGSYSLIINQQSFPKSTQIIRDIMEIYPDAPIITPNKAHQLFGGFELKYDADFREFLLANMDKVLENPEYVSSVASIQKQFSEIKAMNSNRVLTWDLAMSYIQTNKYTCVNVGNERVAEISSIAGYTQQDFETLQQIYNYGKQRTFSSIPRIENQRGKYTYETLRLDDPLAMAIGTLTDCCQELGNCAEVCMEHSMVDKNGRVFVIKDELGNIVAQSWVWRNKDVLCFDNIEIPDKAFARAVKENPELGRKGFTDEVFQIYKQAAQDLMQTDELEYEKLLEEGKITQEQYEGLRLGKVTVGLGYNDIAESLKQNSVVDKQVARPLPFQEPVKLSRGLYTNDSTTQYVLEEREDRKQYAGDTLPIHSDAYTEYDDKSFTEKNLLSLEKLEIITKQNSNYLDTQLSDYDDRQHIISSLAHNYGLNPETTRIVMNPNFAIIYDVNEEQVKIGDLLFNTTIDNNQQQMNIEEQVTIQMRLALEQIAQNKQIDVSSLNDTQLEMYSKVTGLTGEIDYGRGVGHAR